MVLRQLQISLPRSQLVSESLMHCQHANTSHMSVLEQPLKDASWLWLDNNSQFDKGFGFGKKASTGKDLASLQKSYYGKGKVCGTVETSGTTEPGAPQPCEVQNLPAGDERGANES